MKGGQLLWDDVSAWGVKIRSVSFSWPNGMGRLNSKSIFERALTHLELTFIVKGLCPHLIKEGSFKKMHSLTPHASWPTAIQEWKILKK